jgi:hypothetical protein
MSIIALLGLGHLLLHLSPNMPTTTTTTTTTTIAGFALTTLDVPVTKRQANKK